MAVPAAAQGALFLFLVWAGLAPLVAQAGALSRQACLRGCGPKDLPCQSGEAECLLGSGLVEDAIEKLKEAVRAHPESQSTQRALARAYLADDNPLWAQKTLQRALALQEGDCETRSWLAWVFIGQGLMEQAAEVLSRPGCPVTGPERGRWLLLRAYQDQLSSGKPPSWEALKAMGRGASLYPEDRALWQDLHAKARPGWLDPVSLRLDLGFGYTTNAKAGAPVDPDSSGPASAYSTLDSKLRALWPLESAWYPMLEAGIQGSLLTAEEASSLGYWEFAGKPMVALGPGLPRLTVGYRIDHLLLNQEAYASYYTGHRGGIELEGQDWSLFAGAGFRQFMEERRTRTEIDAGGGKAFGPFCRFRFTLAGVGRRHWAESPVYDLVGATALASVRVDLFAGYFAQAGLHASVDHYPRSGGKPGHELFGTIDKRLDLTGRASAVLWTPALSGWRLSAGADVTWRDSSADTAARDFDFTELRFLFRARWSFNWNPWMPATESVRGHVPLEYGLGSGGVGSSEEQRILDLLRQDEADRRGACGCAG